MNNWIHLIKIYGLKKIAMFSLLEIRSLCYRIIYKSYSQHKEDLIIEKIIGRKKNGKYIDIGANDPIRFNNTYKLYENGWSGVNVEPNINKYKHFKAKRYRDINLNIAISKVSKTVEFYSFNPDTLSTISAEVAAQYRDMGFTYLGVHTVGCSTLADISHLAGIHGEYDLLTIDTEGSELEILKTNIWSKFRPYVVCVETIKFDNNENQVVHSQDIIKYMDYNEYKVYKQTKSNTIFVRQDTKYS